MKVTTETADRLDTPGSRGYEWKKLSDRVKDKYDWTCQSCGLEYGTGNPGRGWVGIETHHVVRGRYLPVGAARCDINLVPVCDGCHGRIEGNPPEKQYRIVGWTDIADTIALLKQERVTPEFVDIETGMGVLKAYAVLDQLETIRIARNLCNRLYELNPNRVTDDD